MRERKRQPEQAGQLRTEPAGAKEPYRRHVTAAGSRGDRRTRVLTHEQPDQVTELLREGLRRQAFHRAAQRKRRALVSPRCAANAQIDPARMQCLQRAELLRHHQRGVVRQHHPAGANPDRGGSRRQVRDKDSRRRAGNRRHVVVLGHPEATVPKLLGALGQLGRLAQRLARGRASSDRGKIQNGQRHVDHIVANRRPDRFLPGPPPPARTGRGRHRHCARTDWLAFSRLTGGAGSAALHTARLRFPGSHEARAPPARPPTLAEAMITALHPDVCGQYEPLFPNFGATSFSHALSFSYD